MCCRSCGTSCDVGCLVCSGHDDHPSRAFIQHDLQLQLLHPPAMYQGPDRHAQATCCTADISTSSISFPCCRAARGVWQCKAWPLTNHCLMQCLCLLIVSPDGHAVRAADREGQQLKGLAHPTLDFYPVVRPSPTSCVFLTC